VVDAVGVEAVCTSTIFPANSENNRESVSVQPEGTWSGTYNPLKQRDMVIPFDPNSLEGGTAKNREWEYSGRLVDKTG